MLILFGKQNKIVGSASKVVSCPPAGKIVFDGLVNIGISVARCPLVFSLHKESYGVCFLAQKTNEQVANEAEDSSNWVPSIGVKS